MIKTFLEEDIYIYREDTTRLEEKLLLLNNVDFQLSKNDKLIINLKVHNVINNYTKQSIAYFTIAYFT